MLSKKIGMLFTFLDSALLPQLLNGLYGEGGDGMSVIVKNMEMPQKCGQCKLFHAEQPMYCIVDKNYRTVGAPYGMLRPDWCPLIELPMHGRLIDIKSVEYGKFTTVGNEYQRWWNGALDSVIDNAPTVIEAEGEKDGSIHKRHGDSYKL